MRNPRFLACIPLLLVPAMAGATTRPASGPSAAASQPAESPFASEADKVSYSLGMKIAQTVKLDLPDLNVEALARGLRDALANRTLLTDRQASQILDVYSAKVQNLRDDRLRNPGKYNKQEGDAFLARNAKAPGVKVTSSGLQYRVLQEGDGPTPTAGDIVRVRYRGSLVDGTEFDSSHGRPAPFRVEAVVPGWTEALQMMKVGSRWQLVIPPDLAYGERGAGPLIGPNATLIFDMELVDIRKPIGTSP